MRDAFSLVELIISLLILALVVALSISFPNAPSLHFIASSLLSHIQFTQSLALKDSRFFPHLDSTTLTQSLSPSIDPHKLLSQPQKNMWQIQFHLSGIYTQNSYSIYVDTPRFSPTTNYDGRPMSGDFIALEPFSNQCLSGYNNTNVSDYCKNNTSPLVRLQEGVSKITLEGDLFCKERDGGRIYFDDFGVPYCGKTPQKLTQIFKITLWKNKESLSLCIMPVSGYAFFCDSKI